MITAEVPNLSSSSYRRPAVLRPYIPEEAVSSRLAAKYAGVTPQTIGTPTVKAAVVLPTGYQAAICRG